MNRHDAYSALVKMNIGIVENLVKISDIGYVASVSMCQGCLDVANRQTGRAGEDEAGLCRDCTPECLLSSGRYWLILLMVAKLAVS